MLNAYKMELPIIYRKYISAQNSYFKDWERFNADLSYDPYKVQMILYPVT